MVVYSAAGKSLLVRFGSTVFLLVSNSEIGAHVRRNFIRPVQGICWIELCQKNGFFSPKRPSFLHVCATCPELPSNICIAWFWCRAEGTKRDILRWTSYTASTVFTIQPVANKTRQVPPVTVHFSN